MKRSLVCRQTMFKKAKSKSEAAVNASFIVAAEIAKAARLFIEREFIKKCIVKVCHIVYPDRQQEFLNLTLSRKTLVEPVCQLSTNLHEQLMTKGKVFIA